MSKKILSSVLAAAMFLGLTTPIANAKQTNNNDLNYQYVSADRSSLVKMLIKEGKLTTASTEDEIERVLNNYLQGFQKEYDFSKNQEIANARTKNALSEQGISFRDKSEQNAGAEAGKWNGPVREDKVLVILVDFSDYTHNNIKPAESERYMPNFDKQYYKNMLFKDGTFKGQKDKDMITVRQYYKEQSGGSYSFSGDVYGWYKVPEKAAYYGADKGTNHNVNAKQLVKDAISAVSKDPSVDLSEYDKFNRETGENKPDGVIDHVMIIHAGVGQEAGGGSLGTDSIWSHRSSIPAYEITDVKGRNYKVQDYTMEPEDSAAGVLAHEYGHDLGLPDEYDINYSGLGEPVAKWSIMSGGSWAGDIGGTQPSGFSPYTKSLFQASMPGSRWLKGSTISLDDVPNTGLDFTLDQASIKGLNDDVVRVNLTDRIRTVEQVKGTYSYFSGEVNKSEAYMTLKKPLSVTTTSGLTLKMKSDYGIEDDYDYFYAQARVKGTNNWINLKNNQGVKVNEENGITGLSNGWIDLSFDLDQITTESAISTSSSINVKSGVPFEIEVRFNYSTDPASLEKGVYLDEIQVVKKDSSILLSDDAEKDSLFDMNIFSKSNGTKATKNYYLVEYRSHNGVDIGLKNANGGTENSLKYDAGVVVWYVDEFYGNNADVSKHPGDVLNGVVDADQSRVVKYVNGVPTAYYKGTATLIHDAAFSIRKGDVVNWDLGQGVTMVDTSTFMHPIFDDSRDYSNSIISTQAGRNIPKLGLKMYITSEASDKSYATIHIAK